MEYMILTLVSSTKSSEDLLNEYAKLGWILICPLAEYRLVLGRKIQGV
jgi:hypothetical protein